MSFGALKSRLNQRTASRVEDPAVMETAVALILAPSPQGPEALFIRRAVRAGDPWSGQIGLPGGWREPGDADRLATAVQETLEEIGVALEPDSLLGPLDDLNPGTPSLPPLVIRPYVFGLERRPETRLSDEVAEVLWVSLAELARCEAQTVVTVRGIEKAVPCFLVADAVIWGLTYRILRGLLPLAK